MPRAKRPRADGITVRHVPVSGLGESVMARVVAGPVKGVCEWLGREVADGRNVLALGVHAAIPDNVAVAFVADGSDVGSIVGPIPMDATDLGRDYLRANFLAVFEGGVGVLGGNEALAQRPGIGLIGRRLVLALFEEDRLRGTDHTVLILAGPDDRRAHTVFDLATGDSMTLPSAFDSGDVATCNTVVGMLALVEASVDADGASEHSGRVMATTHRRMRAILDAVRETSEAWDHVTNLPVTLMDLSALDGRDDFRWLGVATVHGDDHQPHMRRVEFAYHFGRDSVSVRLDRGRVRLSGDMHGIGGVVRLTRHAAIFIDPLAQDGQVTVRPVRDLPEGSLAFLLGT